MKQMRIYYKEIMDLGFTEELTNDTVYFEQFGYKWAIIQLKLTKRVYLEWHKDSQHCKMVRVDKEENIKAEMPINDLDHLKQIVDFFKDEVKTYPINVA